MEGGICEKQQEIVQTRVGVLVIYTPKLTTA